MEIVKEKRERVKASEKEEHAAAQAKGKKAAPPKKDDKKKDAKGGDKEHKAGGEHPAEDLTPKVVLPEPTEHINSNIVDFLEHYKAPRLIQIQCANPDKEGHKRSDDEKASLIECANQLRENERSEHESVLN